MQGKHQGANEDCNRVGDSRRSRDLLAVDAEMLFDGGDALESASSSFVLVAYPGVTGAG